MRTALALLSLAFSISLSAQTADVGVAVKFHPGATFGSTVDDAVEVSNHGPDAATNVGVTITTTPWYPLAACCTIAQLAPGASQEATKENFFAFAQTYLSAVTTAREGDPNPSNNAAVWMVDNVRFMVMDALYLTPGASANVMAYVPSNNAGVSSSDSGVISIGGITQVAGPFVTFPVTAHKLGTATISLVNINSRLTIDVVPPGTTPRWPGGVHIWTDVPYVRFDQQMVLDVHAWSTAPLTGARATGTVVVSAGHEELGRGTIDGKTISIPFYMRGLGNGIPITVSYSGDAVYLPQTLTKNYNVLPGQASLSATVQAVPGSAGTFALHVDAAGSPVAAPSGTLAVFNGTTQIATVPLVVSGMSSSAAATLANLPAVPSLTVTYSGDGFYAAGGTRVRIAAPRVRVVRH